TSIPHLLKVSGDIEDEMRRPSPLLAINRETSRTAQRKDGVVGASLPGAEVDDRSEGAGAAGREHREKSGAIRGLRDGDVHRNSGGAGGNSALPCQSEDPRGFGEKRRSAIRPRGSPR